LQFASILKTKLVKGFLLVAIHASPETRYKRLMDRKREDDNLTIDRIKNRDERELRWGIGVLIALYPSVL